MTFQGPGVTLGGRNDLLRRHNLALVLRRVHLAPATRSELTRESGLNRSTIAALVSELQERSLVVEEEPSGTGAIGRPSPLVRPSDVPVAVAVNPEVDAVTVALVRLGGRVLDRRRIPFASGPTVAQAAEVAADGVRSMLAADPAGHLIVGAAVAVPGIVRRADGVVRLAPHLGWRDEPVAEVFADRLGLPVSIANDGRLGARAEWLFGAGRGVADLVFLNGGSSGIGGGVIAGGVALEGVAGHAGEFGHASVRRAGEFDTIGARGTLESEVRRDALLQVLGLDAADPDELEAALLEDRSEAVRAEVRRQVDVLAAAIGDAVAVLNPARVVLGGFLSALAAAAPTRLRRAVAMRELPTLGESVDVRRAELGSDLLLIGAAEPAFAGLLSVEPAG